MVNLPYQQEASHYVVEEKLIPMTLIFENDCLLVIRGFPSFVQFTLIRFNCKVTMQTPILCVNVPIKPSEPLSYCFECNFPAANKFFAVDMRAESRIDFYCISQNESGTNELLAVNNRQSNNVVKKNKSFWKVVESKNQQVYKVSFDVEDFLIFLFQTKKLGEAYSAENIKDYAFSFVRFLVNCKKFEFVMVVDYVDQAETVEYGRLIALVIQVDISFDNFELVSILWMKRANSFPVRLDDKCTNLKVMLLKKRSMLKGVILNNDSVTRWKSVEELKNLILNVTIVR